MKFTLLTRDISGYLVDRYSERQESAEQLSKRKPTLYLTHALTLRC